MLDDVGLAQDGVLTRKQALAGGLTRAFIEHQLATGRWQRIFDGVYATFTGPVPRRAQLWAVVLRAGAGAILSHDSAAELAGLMEPGAGAIHVTVPDNRHPVRLPGVVVHRARQVGARRHPTRTPPQTRLEDTVVDLAESCPRVEDAVAWLARAVGARLTTAERLATAIRRRSRLRNRRLLLATLEDVATGSHSLIELAYLRDVEREHGLPRSERQARRTGGPSRYDDVRYRVHRLRVELDGRAAHPTHRRWRDMRRDNAAVVDGDRVLRYGFGDVRQSPCEVAAQVAAVLRQSGWAGPPHPCARAHCAVS